MNLIARIKPSCIMMQIVVLLFVAMIPACSQKKPIAPSNSSQEQATKDLYKEAFRYKTMCEQSVLSIKEHYTKQEPEYRKANQLYNDAMAEFNTVFEMAKLAIQSDSEFDANKNKNEIEKAEKSGQVFLQYADDIVQHKQYGFAGPAVVATVVPLFEFIFKSTRNVKGAASSEKAEKKKESLSYLESLKWKSFQEIELGE
jgi:hypothetical protein